MHAPLSAVASECSLRCDFSFHCWGLAAGPCPPGLSRSGRCPMTATTPTAALVSVQSVFTQSERLALGRPEGSGRARTAAARPAVRRGQRVRLRNTMDAASTSAPRISAAARVARQLPGAAWDAAAWTGRASQRQPLRIIVLNGSHVVRRARMMRRVGLDMAVPGQLLAVLKELRQDRCLADADIAGHGRQRHRPFGHEGAQPDEGSLSPAQAGRARRCSGSGTR